MEVPVHMYVNVNLSISRPSHEHYQGLVYFYGSGKSLVSSSWSALNGAQIKEPCKCTSRSLRLIRRLKGFLLIAKVLYQSMTVIFISCDRNFSLFSGFSCLRTSSTVDLKGL